MTRVGLVAWHVFKESVRDRVLFAIAAFALLLVAESLLARVLGRGTNDIFEDLSTTPGLLGLAGQVVFALLPCLQLLR